MAQLVFTRFENKIPERLTMTEAIRVEHATKEFTLRYHRTFKQVTVAA